jgi:flagellar biogenesis protein FliO
LDFWLRYGLALFALAIALGVFAAVGRAIRRVRLSSHARRIEVVESAMLAPQTALHIVRIDEREILVGTGEIVQLSGAQQATRT